MSNLGSGPAGTERWPMTGTEDLNTFVRDALARGVPRTEIRDILLQAGWSTRQVSDALAGFADVTFTIPVPKPRSNTDAREAFLYGLLFLALAFSAFHLGALIFAFIDEAFPSGTRVTTLREATRWPVAVLVVTLPVFFYVSRLVKREVRLDPSRRTSRSGTQTTYVTLFLCAAVVIGVLSSLVYNFLGGELTIRFILKSLTAIGIAAGIFAHYLPGIREQTEPAASSAESG